MALSTGQKVGLAIGGIILIGGIATAIYFATKKGTQGGGGTAPGNQGGGTTPAKVDEKKKLSLQQILDIIAKINQYTQESFPLKPGMKGEKVLAMQQALRSKFNQVNVAQDGLFGFKTLLALNELGYTTYLVQNVSKANYDRILEGKYPA